MPRKIMCLKGSRPKISYTGGHIRSSVIGAVKPKDGKFVSLLMPFVDTDVFQLFLYKMEAEVDKRRRNIVVLDNASWHKPERLEWGVLEPWYLPTYSPDLNPIEELWLVIKREFFSWFWTEDHDNLDDRLEKALKYYIDRPRLIQSICSMGTFD